MPDQTPEEERISRENASRVSRHAVFSRTQRLRRPLYWKAKKKNEVTFDPTLPRNAPTLKDGRKQKPEKDG